MCSHSVNSNQAAWNNIHSGISTISYLQTAMAWTRWLLREVAVSVWKIGTACAGSNSTQPHCSVCNFAVPQFASCTQTSPVGMCMCAMWRRFFLDLIFSKGSAAPPLAEQMLVPYATCRTSLFDGWRAISLRECRCTSSCITLERACSCIDGARPLGYWRGAPVVVNTRCCNEGCGRKCTHPSLLPVCSFTIIYP